MIRRERRLKGKSIALKEGRIWASVEFILRQWLELCSTEIELFLLIKSSYSVDFALQFGKAWNKILSVVISVIHSFLLETVVSVCCEEEFSTKPIRAFVKPTVQKLQAHSKTTS